MHSHCIHSFEISIRNQSQSNARRSARTRIWGHYFWSFVLRRIVSADRSSRSRCYFRNNQNIYKSRSNVLPRLRSSAAYALRIMSKDTCERGYFVPFLSSSSFFLSAIRRRPVVTVLVRRVRNRHFAYLRAFLRITDPERDRSRRRLSTKRCLSAETKNLPRDNQQHKSSSVREDGQTPDAHCNRNRVTVREVYFLLFELKLRIRLLADRCERVKRISIYIQIYFVQQTHVNNNNNGAKNEWRRIQHICVDKKKKNKFENCLCSIDSI